jgi:hypothetical protein
MSTPQKPANRRGSLRRASRKSIHLQCRRGSLGLGANLASTFTDISESGLQLTTLVSIKSGEEVELVFEGYGMRTPIRRIGEVRWVENIESGGCRAGIRFQKYISYRELQMLTAP